MLKRDTVTVYKLRVYMSDASFKAMIFFSKFSFYCLITKPITTSSFSFSSSSLLTCRALWLEYNMSLWRIYPASVNKEGHWFQLCNVYCLKKESVVTTHSLTFQPEITRGAIILIRSSKMKHVRIILNLHSMIIPFETRLGYWHCWDRQSVRVT